MAISYDLITQLKPSLFVDSTKVKVYVPVHVVEKHKNLGVNRIFEIELRDVPTKEETISKIDELLQKIMALIPGLDLKDFSFRFVGGFCNASYV